MLLDQNNAYSFHCICTQVTPLTVKGEGRQGHELSSSHPTESLQKFPSAPKSVPWLPPASSKTGAAHYGPCTLNCISPKHLITCTNYPALLITQNPFWISSELSKQSLGLTRRLTSATWAYLMHFATSKSALFKHLVSIVEKTGAWDSAPGPREPSSKLRRFADLPRSATFQQPSHNKPHCSVSGDN